MLPQTYEKLPIDREGRLADLRATLLARANSFVATLVVLNGTAEIVDPLTKRPRSAEAGVRLAANTQLTVKSGRALVRMEDGSDLWLEGGSTLDLSPWSMKARSLRLVVGRALAFVAKEVARPFTIESPLGGVLVTGTAFGMEVGRDTLTVSIFHGSVRVSNNRGEADGRRGQRVVARRDRTPVAEPLTAAVRAAWAWLGDIAATAINPAVSKAYGATRNALALPRPSSALLPRGKSGSRGYLLSLLAVTGIAVAAWGLWPDFKQAAGERENPLTSALPASGTGSSAAQRATMQPSGPALSGGATVGTAPRGAQPSNPPSVAGTSPLAISPDGSHTFSFSTADGSIATTGDEHIIFRFVEPGGKVVERQFRHSQEVTGALPGLSEADREKMLALARRRAADGAQRRELKVFTWNNGDGFFVMPPAPPALPEGLELPLIGKHFEAMPEEVRAKIEAELLEARRKVDSELAGHEHYRAELERINKDLKLRVQIERQVEETRAREAVPPAPATAP